MFRYHTQASGAVSGAEAPSCEEAAAAAAFASPSVTLSTNLSDGGDLLKTRDGGTSPVAVAQAILADLGLLLLRGSNGGLRSGAAAAAEAAEEGSNYGEAAGATPQASGTL